VPALHDLIEPRDKTSCATSDRVVPHLIELREPIEPYDLIELRDTNALHPNPVSRFLLRRALELFPTLRSPP
jgi:hypothetical protein